MVRCRCRKRQDKEVIGHFARVGYGMARTSERTEMVRDLEIHATKCVTPPSNDTTLIDFLGSSSQGSHRP